MRTAIAKIAAVLTIGLLVSYLASCRRTTESSQASADVPTANNENGVQLEIRRVREFPQLTATGNVYSNDVELDTMLWNQGKEPVRFDMLSASFYAGDRLMCGTSSYLTREDKVRSQFSLDKGDGPPEFFPSDDHTAFEIAPTEGTRFILKSANCDFASAGKRKVAVELIRLGGATVATLEVPIKDVIDK